MTDVNDKLPKVTVLDSGEKPVDLSTLSGPFILYSYPKADTPGCTREGQEFSDLLGDFKKLGFAIYGISKDKPKKLAKFTEKYGLKVELLSDEASDAIEQMGLWVEKTLYGRKYMGIERCTMLVGKDGKVAQIWHNVKVPGHAEAVLEAAKAL